MCIVEDPGQSRTLWLVAGVDSFNHEAELRLSAREKLYIYYITPAGASTKLDNQPLTAAHDEHNYGMYLSGRNSQLTLV